MKCIAVLFNFIQIKSLSLHYKYKNGTDETFALMTYKDRLSDFKFLVSDTFLFLIKIFKLSLNFIIIINLQFYQYTCSIG